MIPAQRQHYILSQLADSGVLSIAELTDILKVSHMTVRRDIQQLERAGRVVSVTGGVRLPERMSLEPSHVAKSRLQHSQKEAIGRVAATLVPKNGVIYLDAGTTILEVARNIAERRDVTVVTNDFAIASFLMAESACELYHTGGKVERENQSCVGDATAEAICQFNFDIAFVSTSSWTIGGISTPTAWKVPVKKAIIQSSARSILVADSSKYGVVAALNAISLDAFDALITDGDLPGSVAEAIKKRNVNVIIAEEKEGRE